MQHNPLVSVIVPIYNVEKYLRKCLDSIINQTYTNLEIILVDDGSPDNCPSICDEYKNKDTRIIVIHKENEGLGFARNSGLDICTGAYIMFVDSDDWLELHMIESLYNRLLKDKSDMCVASCLNIYEETGEIIKDVLYTDKAIDDKTLMLQKVSTYTVAWGKLYKKELFETIRFPKKFSEDAFVCYLLIDKCNRISHIQECLYNYLVRTNSLMGSNFSFKNLDTVEVNILKAEFYLSKNMIDYALTSLANAVQPLYRGYTELDIKDTLVQHRLAELEVALRTAYKKLLFKPGSIKLKFVTTLFLCSKQLYGILKKI